MPAGARQLPAWRGFGCEGAGVAGAELCLSAGWQEPHGPGSCELPAWRGFGCEGAGVAGAELCPSSGRDVELYCAPG